MILSFVCLDWLVELYVNLRGWQFNAKSRSPRASMSVKHSDYCIIISDLLNRSTQIFYICFFLAFPAHSSFISEGSGVINFLKDYEKTVML